jgi:outer membrane protein assembly factor BamB
MIRVVVCLTVLVALCGAGCGEPAASAPAAVAGQTAARQSAARGEVPQEVVNSQLSSTVADSAVLPTLGKRTTGVDWPVFLGPSGNSKSTETGIIKKWPAEGLKVVWHKPLGTSYGAPTISRGRLFQFDRFGDVSRLYCLNAETGEELWRQEYPSQYEDLYGYNNGPRCSPVVDGERVYAFGVDGMLLCCQAADGKLVWKKNLNEQYGVVQNFFGVGSTPVVEGDKLIVMVGGSPAESQRVPPGALDRVVSNGTGIVAFDKMTGEEKYRLADELASYASLKLATIGDRRWCFAFCRGGLVGFEPVAGQLDFHYAWRDAGLESVNASVPVVAGDQVFISETYGPGSTLLKVGPGKHEVLWQDDQRRRERAMQTHWNTPIYLDGYLYGCSGRHEYTAELRCIEWGTGNVMWSQPGMNRTSLTYLDGHFLCLGELGQLWLIKANPQKYEEVAMIDYSDPKLGQPLLGTPGPVLRPYCWAAPVVSHGLLYVRGADRLLCLELIPES